MVRLTFLHFSPSGCSATMSMSENHLPWLWDMLSKACDVDEGRTAVMKSIGHSRIIASIFQVLTPGGREHTIKTITTGFETKDLPLSNADAIDDAPEWIIVSILDKRCTEGKYEYQVLWEDADPTWEPATVFIDNSGHVTDKWLVIAGPEELRAAFNTLPKQR